MAPPKAPDTDRNLLAENDQKSEEKSENSLEDFQETLGDLEHQAEEFGFSAQPVERGDNPDHPFDILYTHMDSLTVGQVLRSRLAKFAAILGCLLFVIIMITIATGAEHLIEMHLQKP